MNVLVIPSNRQEQLTAFFYAWRGVGGWDEVVLIEDGPAITFDVAMSDKPVRHFSHAEIAAALGDRAWIISKGDSACRAFGFYAAWKMGAEYILTLDDDVRPCAGFEQICDHHVYNMTRYSHFQSSAHGLWPRGMPGNDEAKGTPSVSIPRKDVKASMGLWTGVPDMYAQDVLDLGAYPTDYQPPPGKRLLPEGEFVPICGMNFCIHRDAAPLCYFPLQGQGQPYSRFDDIWMGLILKRGFDALRWKVCVGEPFVHHSRASNVVKCAEAEKPGRLVNDAMWKWFHESRYRYDLQPGGSSVSTAYYIGGMLIDHGCGFGTSYSRTMGHALITWSRLFEE